MAPSQFLHGGGDALRVAADEHGVTHLAAAGRRERREVGVLAVAAGDQHERAAHPVDGRDGRADVRPLRVVHVAHAVDIGDPLRAVRQPAEIRERGEHRRVGQFERLAHRERRHRVGGVVPAL